MRFPCSDADQSVRNAVGAEPRHQGRAGDGARRPGAGEGATAVPAAVVWTSEAEARVERVPSFIRPMARRAIERFAAERGYSTIDATVMDEARGAFGM